MNIIVNERDIKISQLPASMIRFKNFEGKRWNDNKRDFTIDLDIDSGRRAEDFGWTGLSWKHKTWNDPDSELVPCLKIKIGEYRPTVYYASSDGRRTPVNFEQIDIDHIDNRDLEWISVYATAYDSDNGPKHYRTAYANEIVIKFKPSPFASEFSEDY